MPGPATSGGTALDEHSARTRQGCDLSADVDGHTGAIVASQLDLAPSLAVTPLRWFWMSTDARTCSPRLQNPEWRQR